MKQLTDYGIDHIGFLVPDREAAVNHVKEHYGIQDVVYVEPFIKKAWTNGQLHTQLCKVALVSFADNQTKFEFIEPVSEGGYHWDFVKSGKSGVNHIGIKVHDFDYWREHFKVKGDDIFFEYETEDEEMGYRRCLYATDSFLNMVYEIKEINRFRDANGNLEP